MIELIRKFAPALTGFAVGMAMAWGLQALRLTALGNEFAAYRVQAEVNDLAARAAVLDAEAHWSGLIKEAENEYKARLSKVTADSAASRRAVGGLRDELAALRSRLADAPAAAVADALDTAGDVLGECAERYRAMAASADRHAADVELLTRAWPR
jgi:hypothetical protein